MNNKNDIKYDIPKIDEMQRFLNFLYTIGLNNPDISINRNIIYNELCKYGLKESEIDSNGKRKSCAHLFKEWLKRNNITNNWKKGLTVYHNPNWKHFLQFYATNSRAEFDSMEQFIKLYIPISYDNIYDDINLLFDGINNMHIKHSSKLADTIRSDNTIVWLDVNDTDSAMKIIGFVNNNFQRGKSLNSVNPFVPTINGIGFTYCVGDSYNSEISNIMSMYINNCINNKKSPKIMEFYEQIKNSSISSELKYTFMCAMGDIRKVGYSLNNFENIPIIEEVKEKVDLSFEEKEKIFMNAVFATYNKYGFLQVNTAISNAINNNNYRFFTNGDRGYRKQLALNVTREEIVSFVTKYVDNGKKDISGNDVDIFCYKLFGKKLLETINKVCLYTLDKEGEERLKEILKSMILWNRNDKFPDDIVDNTTYQDIMNQFLGKNVWEIIKMSLGFIIIENDYNYLDELINVYIRRLKVFLENNRDYFLNGKTK